MVIKDFLSISGEPGLYKYVAQGKNSIIVEQLGTKKKMNVFSSAKVSSLDEISVFTKGEDIPLGNVFDSIFDKEDGGPAINFRSDSKAIKEYFNEILPDYDPYRVYVSDMKKILQWYNALHENNMLVKSDPEDEGDVTTAEESGE